MRNILCEECATKQRKVDGQRCLYPAMSFEPAEFERVVWGKAKAPRAEDRELRVNGEPIALTPNQYECDSCNAIIRPGDRCCAWSAWVDGRTVPPWEHYFVDREGATA